MHVVLEPGLSVENRREALKQVRPRERREDRVARALEAVLRHEVPELPEPGLVPVRIDEEVAGDPVTERPRDPRGLDRRPDAGVLHDPGETLVGGGLEAEEDVEVLGERPPRLEKVRPAADQVRARLDEEPPLLDAALLQGRGESEAALGVVPEEVVRDEHVLPDRGEIVHDRADRPLAEGSAVELPDRAEAAAVRTPAGRLDQPDRSEEEAVIAVPVSLDQGARRNRDAVERGPLRERRGRDPTLLRPESRRRHLREGLAVLESV